MFSSKIEISGAKEELMAYFNALEPECSNADPLCCESNTTSEGSGRASNWGNPKGARGSVPEEGFKSERASYNSKFGKDKLIVEINAEDATAFRAVTNTIVGLISVVEKSIKETKKKNG